MSEKINVTRHVNVNQIKSNKPFVFINIQSIHIYKKNPLTHGLKTQDGTLNITII